MLNFTVGPVQSGDNILKIGAEQVPYFRTSEFSDVMLENERLVKKFAYAQEESRVVFLTGSGTAAMEAAVINFFDKRDRILVINGGSFGQRFARICEIHGLDYDAIILEPGKTLKKEDLYKYDGKGYTGLLVNIHETSTGVLYDAKMIGEFCKKNNIFFVADAVSAFLADPLDVDKYNINVMITGSQKALACPPGISLVLMDGQALSRLEDINSGCMYLDIKEALESGVRGQTPFTPAVGTLLQINERLKEIDSLGGAEAVVKNTRELALYFREGIKAYPFEIMSESLSNAVTPLGTSGCSAYDIFIKLKDEYKIWVCPNGGDMKDKLFRVGHIGYIKKKDYDILFNALSDMKEKGFF